MPQPPTGVHGDAQPLWQQWQATRLAETRTRLFFHYGAWLRMLTGILFSRYPHPLAEWGDYMNLASIGLLQAIDRFDPQRNSRFEAYAEPYIKGNVLKGLACYIRDSKSPSSKVESIAEGYGLDNGDFDLEQLANTAIDLAFGYFLELGIAEQQLPGNNPLQQYEADCDNRMLEEAIKQLSGNQQQVIVCHYYQHMGFTEISEMLGVTRSRVSQLHAQALRRIRQSCEGVFELEAGVVL